MFESFLAATLRTATPLILASMGSIISTRVGVFNISLEGVMNMGAFIAVVMTFFTLSPAIGIFGAMLVGGILSLLFILIVEYLHANETIVAIGINLMSAGLTTFLTKFLFNEGVVSANQVKPIPSIDIPILRDIPVLNGIFNNHTLLVYVAPIIVILMSFIMYKTSFGIKLRASGENPHALETAGISSRKYRIMGVVCTGFLCGLAGAHLSLGYVTMFSEGLVAGRGFIAYTAVVFGRSNPFLTMGACFIFAFAEALSYRSQQIGIPSQIISMLPYIATLVALAIQSNNLKKQSLRGKLA